MNKKQISINMIAGLVSSGVTLAVSFFLTPYIVAELGDEAYGYVGLSGNFVTLATIFTTALNSMANRFILIAYEKKDLKKVEQYYSSLLLGGIVLSIIFLLSGGMFSLFADKVFKISPSLINATKITLGLSVVNFCVITVFTVFSQTAFVKNRLDLTSKAEIGANFAKILVLIALFTCFSPKIYFVAIGGLVYTLVLYICHIHNTRHLLPRLSIRLSLAKWKNTKELVLAGSWNSFNGLTQFLMVGMDLALANWLLDGRAMGLISIANTITVASNSILVAVTASFFPTLAKSYAQGDMLKLHHRVEQINRIQAAVLYVPLIGVILFSGTFYSLWMPYKTEEDILILSLITAVKVADQVMGLTDYAVHYNFVMYNHVRQGVLARLGLSLLNIPIVLLLVRISHSYVLDIFIIAGVSTVLYTFYYWGAVPRLVSDITGWPKKDYYRMIAKNSLMITSLLALYVPAALWLPCNQWQTFLPLVIIMGGTGYIVMFIVGTNRNEKKFVLEKICEKMCFHR